MKREPEDQSKEPVETLACPFCRSSDMTKYGHYRLLGISRQRWLCRRCGRITAFPLSFKSRRSR